MTPFRDVMAELESKAAEWGARAGAAYRAAFEAEVAGLRPPQPVVTMNIETDGDEAAIAAATANALAFRMRSQ